VPRTGAVFASTPRAKRAVSVVGDTSWQVSSPDTMRSAFTVISTKDTVKVREESERVQRR